MLRNPSASICLAAAMLVACAPMQPPVAPPQGGSGQPQPQPEWAQFRLPGKPATLYQTALKDGRYAWWAQADHSASMWRHMLRLEPAQLARVEFSWWVDGLIAGADLSQPGLGDAPARLVFAFGGDRERLSMRNRMVFDLAEALGGEAPPFATLMYVWTNHAELGSVLIHPHTDRIRQMVVESGPSHLRQWRTYDRDLAADFRQAFGEEPGPLIGVALMTDADNMATQAQAWYGDIRIDGLRPLVVSR